MEGLLRQDMPSPNDIGIREFAFSLCYADNAFPYSFKFLYNSLILSS